MYGYSTVVMRHVGKHLVLLVLLKRHKINIQCINAKTISIHIIWGGSTQLWGGSTLDNAGRIDSGADRPQFLA